MKIVKISATLPSKPGKATEAKFKKILDLILAANKKVLDLLAAVEKTKLVAPASLAEVKKQQGISEKSRKAELNDLAKSAKRGELHSNPAKLTRLIKDLNGDIAVANGIEGGIKGKLGDHFGDQVNDLEAEITKALPKGVTAASIGLPRRMTAFKSSQSKKGWATFTAGRKEVNEACETAAEEEDRKNKINGLMHARAHLVVRYKVRQKVIKAGIDNPRATSITVEKLLEGALVKQNSPDKSRWASYLNLGAGGRYRVVACGTYNSVKIHWTMSSDSWTANADGKVSLQGGSAASILSDLLKSANWKQLHTTLEVGPDTRDWPHVYLYAGVRRGDSRWANVARLLGRDERWVQSAQAEMTKELDEIKADLIGKINQAKTQNGANM